MILVCALAAPALAEVPEGGLQAQLRTLAEAEGVAVKGIERVGEASAREMEGGNLAARLKSLLFGYNYMLMHDSAGNIAEVRILGVERPAAAIPSRFAVPATRRGPHHEVDAVLVGPTGAWRQLPLILDTGASTIVLPASTIGRLGFRAADLEDGMAETAGGQVKAKVGRLASVTVGQAVVRDVAVLFIEDARIGGKALLGMSFLDHFRLTIDDAGQQIILTRK
ncbi:MAG: TIGR02281 family clan AA aspartic protease [Kiloniellaceae bacterium]